MRRFRVVYNIISHKFYHGQGLHLNLNLTKRNYNIKVETIWEDYGLVEIDGLTGIKNYSFVEQQSKGIISDQDLDLDIIESIQMTLKLPQYSSYSANLYGSINHIKTFVDSKFKGQEFNINILSKQSQINMKSIQAERFRINNPYGKTNIGSLISKNAYIKSKQFQSQKVMISQKLEIDSQKAYLRSLLLQNSQADLIVRDLLCDSIQGKTKIKSQKAIIKRWYTGIGQIDVESKAYQLKIESGSGRVKGYGQLTLGKDHKGQIQIQSATIKNIIYTNQ